MSKPQPTWLRLATCARCSSPVLVGEADGMNTALDPVRYTRDELRPHLIAGRVPYRLWTLVSGSLTASRLTTPAWNLPGAQTGSYALEHGCGYQVGKARPGRQARAFPPPSAPASLAGNARPDKRGLSPVTNVTAHRSDPHLKAVRCAVCRKPVPRDNPDGIIIEFPVWQENEFIGRKIAGLERVTRIHKGWGYSRWAIHSQCANTSG